MDRPSAHPRAGGRRADLVVVPLSPAGLQGFVLSARVSVTTTEGTGGFDVAADSRVSAWAEARDLQSAIEITLQRFAEYYSLQGALGRRALIEQAKGILMERYAIDADKAFDLLRERSQRGGRKLADIAAALVTSHPLLSPNSERPGLTRRPADGELTASSEAAPADQPKLVAGDGLTESPMTVKPSAASRFASRGRGGGQGT
jgi:ANTAR domain